MKIILSKEIMERSFLDYLGEIFKYPEISCAVVKEIVITRETVAKAGKKALEACFHDKYSDIDMSLKVLLPRNGSVGPEEYIKRIDRFGVSEDTALGWMLVPENNVYRIIFNNGLIGLAARKHCGNNKHGCKKLENMIESLHDFFF